MSSITSLTADYEAIERAIRETSRGRWFLSCYLERNRSSETKMLMGAIAKLESAIRDNGEAANGARALDTLMSLHEAINQTREDMAYLPGARGDTAELPLKRFDFERVPAALAEETKAIRDAAASIQSAAYALQAAGVFQGVASQIIGRAEIVERSCATQEAMLSRSKRMASLLSEIEAELMSIFDDEYGDAFYDEDHLAEIRSLTSRVPSSRISDELIEEISAALGAGPDEDGYGGLAKL
jgi:hypothetical protein